VGRGGGGGKISLPFMKSAHSGTVCFFSFFRILYKRNVLRVRSSLTTCSIEACCTAVCLDSDISL